MVVSAPTQLTTIDSRNGGMLLFSKGWGLREDGLASQKYLDKVHCMGSCYHLILIKTKFLMSLISFLVVLVTFRVFLLFSFRQILARPYSKHAYSDQD
jgi:hypothetical protein